jgi:hypothetical protein
MKPGDLVVAVTGDLGIIVREVDSGDRDLDLTTRWCDWWVLVGAGRLKGCIQAFPAQNLQLIGTF